jgi:hypothetical protein
MKGWTLVYNYGYYLLNLVMNEYAKSLPWVAEGYGDNMCINIS